MKKKDESKKENAVLSNVLKKASDFGSKTVVFGKKAAGGIQSGAKVLSEKAKNANYLKRLEKYKPLFPKDYKSKEFNLPNMVMIVDDAVRRGIDVCEGAIGWLGTETGMEVLFLYDEWVKRSGIQFIPAPKCDEIYYVDTFNRNRFIRVDCIFTKAHEEKLAELEHIAYSLGAKRCSVEIVEADAQMTVQRKSVENSTHLGKFSSNESAEKSSRQSASNQRSGRKTTMFAGNCEPKRPELKWFSNDENIKRLIEMRCSDANSIKSTVLELEGSSSATMSQKAAYAIDCAINKMGNKTKLGMEHQATKESSSKMMFEIEF